MAINHLQDGLRQLSRREFPSGRHCDADGQQPALDRQLDLLELAVRHAYDDQEDVDVALPGDQQGIGSGPDVRAGDRDGSAKTTR